ncbi:MULTISPECIES: exodeoxyribonuclease I [Gammaproteobacteria]|uniref:exodeoxyribonuclease I n=1 Tax=Gammaproteobacteria TaxID=1236 RepID=UPI000DCFC080|nr:MULTISPECIES: exodeoxyribonuclease I [Gammaproteobacteria]RTE87308.1 exodeoxyribonuclease I [Aliidiomarina sp. B3213]TCZ92906.1 exodeoxyribonuclease I [Lysobacter sp. N42]
MTQTTFYWHDYEAGGVNPRVDRPMQFAGIRTDSDLNIVGEPLNIFCQLAPDYLPHPEACLITGITPQQCQRDGFIETEFAGKIAQELSVPGTVSIGYNNVRYDDEMTRFLFYRNFIDPYAHTWENGNSRWDLLELVRACYALRPEGITWPEKEDGSVSLKLEDLSRVNQLDHGKAHDALSDVYASIALAKLIKTKHPKLFDFAFSKRKKNDLVTLIEQSMVQQKPLVHVSGFYGKANRYCRLIMPVAFHPQQSNQLIAWRLDINPEQWHNATPEEILSALYSKELGPEEKPGLVKITLNQCPFLAPAGVLEQARASEIGIDLAAVQGHLSALQNSDHLKEILVQAVSSQQPDFPDINDVDQTLYSGGFISNQTKSHMSMVRSMQPEQLQGSQIVFEDNRFNTLLKRYKARNYPQLLSDDELNRWMQHCRERMQFGGDGYLSLEDFALALNEASERHADDPAKVRILKDLYLWAQNL